MDKLEVGMYVRTEYGINKIDETFYTVSGVNHSYIKLENRYIDDENDLRQGISIENIIKASFDIIDLIELGDIVITQLGEIIQPNGGNIDELKDYWKITNNPIKSIVTKEQFESMKYEVE